MKTTLSLLPQTPEGVLQSIPDQLRILMLKKSLIDVAISALGNFLVYEKMYEFDGHVGENLCQIRAYQIYLLKLNPDVHNYISLTQTFVRLQKISRRLMEAIQYYKSKKFEKSELSSITSFFQQHNAICALSETEIYLIKLHLLSRFKYLDPDGNAAIDYKNMCDTLNVSKHMARRIIHLYQIDISLSSVNFIYSLIMRNQNFSFFESMVSDFKKIDEDGRFTLPCYWVMRILYEDMLKKNCPILVICKRTFRSKKIDTVYIKFRPSATLEGDYEYSESDNSDDFCFVIEGLANYSALDIVPNREQYIKHFIRQGIKNILFANMASHPQYSGKKLSKYKESPYLNILQEMDRYSKLNTNFLILEKVHSTQQEMKNQALRLGCSKQIPSFFYIRHIFCDTLARQFKLEKPPESQYNVINEPLVLDRAVGE